MAEVNNDTDGGVYNPATREISLTGGVILLAAAATTPGSVVYGETISGGEAITIESADRRGGGSAGVSVTNLGVPTFMGVTGQYEITYKLNNGADKTALLPFTMESLLESMYFTSWPKDANGNVVIPAPTPNSRIYYVDNTATPASGQYQQLSTITGDWRDPTTVTGEVYSSADELPVSPQRTGETDYILFKDDQDHTYSEAIVLRYLGASISAPHVIANYGNGTNLPNINAVSSYHGGFIRTNDATPGNCIIANLGSNPVWRDPDDVSFVGWGSANTDLGDFIDIYSGGGGTANGSFLIENIHLKWVSINYGSNGFTPDITMRRCSIQHTYSESSHRQGLFYTNMELLLEECYFNHCGWYKQSVLGTNIQDEGQATIFNHSTYGSGINRCILRKNVSVDPSSIHFKLTANSDSQIHEEAGPHYGDIVQRDNYCLWGELGVGGFGNESDDYEVNHRAFGFQCVRNVCEGLGYQQPTNRTSSAVGGIGDCKDSMLCGNLNLNPGWGNVAITSPKGFNIGGHSSNNIHSDNIMVGSWSGQSPDTGGHRESDDVDVFDTINKNYFLYNLFRNTGTGNVVGDALAANKDGIVRDSNFYEAAALLNEQCYEDGILSSIADRAVTLGETLATVGAIAFKDDTRNLLAYMTHRGETPTIAAFRAKMDLQRGATWDDNFSGDALCAWILDGFRKV